MFLHRLRTIKRRQLYTGADATMMEAALNLCEWKLNHNIKTAAFERLSKLLKKHMLPKDGSELTEAWYQVEQSLNVPDIKKPYSETRVPTEVEQHDNDVFVGEVMYFMESKAPLRPNIRKGHDAFPVGLKHIEEKYLWMSCFGGAHMAALFVALDELPPYVPDAIQDFTPHLARARNHTEAIDKAFRFRLAFLRRLNEVKRVHAKDEAVLSDVFDEFWPRDTQTGIPYPLEKTPSSVGVLAQKQMRAGGIIKHNTNAVKTMAATQAVPGDNVDEGNSPEPPAKKAKQPAKPAAGVPARGRGGAGAMVGGGAFGSRAARCLRPPVAAASAREPQAGRRGGSGRNRMEIMFYSARPPAHCRAPRCPLPGARSLALVPRALSRILGQSGARLSDF
eukprot:jgi/Tetstr1/428955/TSEL_018930.t1